MEQGDDVWSCHLLLRITWERYVNSLRLCWRSCYQSAELLINTKTPALPALCVEPATPLVQ